MTESMSGAEPHAYAVEVLWNRGSRGERWARAMEMDDVNEPLSREEAAGLLEEMMDEGHAPEAVRLVAMVVEPR